jgi:hypothetical protein
MRFTDLSNKTILEFIEELDEVRMGASDLAAFAKSPTAQGIRAGFEAELCFTGLGGSDGDDDSYPEPNYDEDRSPRSIDDIVSFFHDGDHNSRSDVARLGERLREAYWDWRGDATYNAWMEVAEREVSNYIEENVFDFDEAVEEYLTDDLGLSEQEVRVAMNAGKQAQEISSSKQLGLFADENEAYAAYAEARDHANELLQAMVKEALDNSDRNYDAAREQWEEENGDFSEREWLESEGLDSMSEISNNYDISWPYYDYPSNENGNEYNLDNANELARSLGNTLNVEVKASSGYHNTKRREGLWIMEPDGSLEADDGDMPVEIISPPMPLEECLIQMREFFAWAKSERAYSNESTGLHVGVSLPDVGGNIDYVKLALFLGDKYILDKFNRDGNSYCKSALEKIEKDIFNKDPEQITTAVSAMRSGLQGIAAGIITNELGHGKYTSINLKGDYVEFRSMGGEDYINNIDDVINTVQRFALAMSIAGDKNAYRDEYNKKLYKLINPAGSGSDAVSYFAGYVAGTVPKNTLKYWLRQRQTERQAKKTPQGPGEKWWWKVVYQNAGIEVVAVSEESAKRQARVYWDLPYRQVSDAQISAEPLSKYDPDEHTLLGARRHAPEMPPVVSAPRRNLLPGNQNYEVYRVGTGEVVGTFVNGTDPESARLGFQRFMARYDISSPAGYGYRAVQ